MLDSGIEINVFPLSEHFDITAFYKNVMTLNLDELSGSNQFLAHCPRLEDLADDLRVKETKKRSTASLPLTIGSKWTMAVKIYTVRRRATRDSAVYLDARSNQPLTTESRFIDQDTGQIVDETQWRTYHEYGPNKHRVYFDKKEMTELKTFGAPSMVLLGFKPMDRLKLYMNIRASCFLYPDEERCTGSTVAFNALMMAMSDTLFDEAKDGSDPGVFAVCRLIMRKAQGPQFVALVPQRERKDRETQSQLEPPGMHMVFLPFADDLRKCDIAGLSEMKRCDPLEDENDCELVDSAKELVEKLTATELPSVTNPVLQKHYDALEALALDEKVDEEKDGEFVDDIKADHEAMEDVASESIANFLRLIGSRGGMAASKKKGTSKRKRGGDNSGTASKKRKMSQTEDVDDGLDWKSLAENDELKSLKVVDLNRYLKAHGLSKTGRKADKVERIRAHVMG